MKKNILKFSFSLMVLCIFSTLIIPYSASAAIFASGDSTPAYYASDADNNVFFLNVLEGGNNVVVHETLVGSNINTYYDSLAGVSSSYYSDTLVTASLLSGIDLFVTGMVEGAFTESELNVLTNFVDTGGSIYFMGEYDYSPDGINAALNHLGSAMSLYEPYIDPGNWYATGDKIALDPFTTGVSSFRYGATYGVSGGTGLFFDSQDRAFIAYDPVPVPGALVLLCSGLIGIAGLRRESGKK